MITKLISLFTYMISSASALTDFWLLLTAYLTLFLGLKIFRYILKNKY